MENPVCKYIIIYDSSEIDYSGIQENTTAICKTNGNKRFKRITDH